MNEPSSFTGLRYSPVPEHDDELRAVATTSDPLGVLSAYVDFAEAGQHRAAARAERAARSLADAQPLTMSRAAWRSILDAAIVELTEIASRPAEPGERARAVFVPLRDGTGVGVPLAVPTPNAVTVARHPHVRLLLGAAVSSRPVAVVRTGRSGIVLKELFGDSVRAQWTLPFPQGRSERRLEGPSRPRSEDGRRAHLQGDLVWNRRAAHIHAAMAEAVGSIAAMAERRTWRAVVVWGNAEDGPELAGRLRDQGVAPCLVAHDIDARSEVPRALAAVDDAERLDALERARELVALADSGGAVIGAGAVRRALGERRAAFVVIGAPDAGPSSALPVSPLLALGADEADDPLESIAWSAFSGRIPVATAPAEAGALIPPPHVGAFLHMHDTEGSDAHVL